MIPIWPVSAMLVNMPNVHTVMKGARTYYYHRPTRTKLPGTPDTAEFQARLAELNEQIGTPDKWPAPLTVDALISEYKANRLYRDKAPKTRKSYTRYLDLIGMAWGSLLASGIKPKHVSALQDRFSETPRTANYIVQVVSRLMNFGITKGYATTNPAALIEHFQGGAGHRPWEEFEIAQFRARWTIGTLERTAFELYLNTGQRGGDIVEMTRQRYQSGAITVTQNKTKERVWIPVAEQLADALTPWLDAHQHIVMLASARGRPLHISTLQHTMRSAIRDAGLPDDCTLHGLRYTAAAILHELGLDWEIIGSITGHQTAQMVRKYIAKKRNAQIAIARLNAARRTGTERESVNPADLV